MPDLKVALQLYTVRDECAQDFPGTLKKVAAIGYKSVELAGLYGLEPEAVRATLDECGLTVAGAHEGMEALTKDLDATLARHRALGTRYIVCPYAKESSSTEPGVWDGFAEQCNRVGQACREAGFTFAYHNHAHEFTLVEGAYGLDRLMERTDPELVQLEVDAGWVWFAGVDPANYIRKYPGRVPLIHAKDHDREDKNLNRPVGNGALDWTAIWAAARAVGTEYAVVEEDACIEPCLHSVALSLRNMQSMGVA